MKSTSSRFPGPGVSTQVSTNGGTTPQWREQRREIFYLGPDNRLDGCPSDACSRMERVEAGTPTALFTIPQGGSYDVTHVTGNAS